MNASPAPWRTVTIMGAILLAGSAAVRPGHAADAPPPAPGDPGADVRTVLGIQGTRFLLNGEPAFLLGFSYYGALGAPDAFVREDLEDAQRCGFHWLRVWATWNAFDSNVSAVDADGRAREPFLGRLRRLVAECDRRGMVVDVTLTRAAPRPGQPPGAGLPNNQAHLRAVETLVTALAAHRNWYLDLANERDVRDARYVPAAELKTLRDAVRRLDPERLVTASFGGHDLSEGDLREALFEVGVDFLAPHRPRNAQSPGQTEARTREWIGQMERLGRVVP
ncbi:MAG: hypothetical protein JXR77_13405, partial [Lentisphaeria bacterium]|nr:hypothetical protein [Lentisphaeria bacterium]